MTAPAPHEVTGLLIAWNDGDEQALEKLTPMVHDELRRLAHHYMSGERRDHTLETAALINEAYVRLIDGKRVRWQNRAHFIAVSARLMRRILVDFARAHRSSKRGGDLWRVTLDEGAVGSEARNVDLVALDKALEQLARIDTRKSKVVELRYFGGLSIRETAEALNVSPITVQRDWDMASVLLLREMGEENSDEA